MNRNLKITIWYKGTNYHGFQVQNNASTICQTFQDSVEKVLGQRYCVTGCSRTDAGVHASGFVLSLLCDHSIPCKGLQFALNNSLPPDISVLDCCEVDGEFHPRYSAVGKKYVYSIWNGVSKNPFSYETTYHHPKRLDIDAMDKAAREMIGRYDFTSFCASGSSVEDKVRLIYSCSVEKKGDLVEVVVVGDGFLYNMVRIIVGTLLEVSYGKFTTAHILPMIEAKDRTKAGATAPSTGLCLSTVYYSQTELEKDVEVYLKQKL